MNRSLIIVLAGSLALNVFAGGFILGRALAPQPEPPILAEARTMRGLDNPFRIMRSAEALPVESRMMFREAFRTQLPELRERHREMRRLRLEFATLLQAEEWDRDAVAAKLEEINAAQNRQRDAFKAAYIDAFGKLTAGERRLLIEAARSRRSERGKRFMRGERDRPPPGQ